MGLFNRNTKDEWSINRRKGTIELTPTYIRIKKITREEQIIFYKDITLIEKKYTTIKLKTKSDEIKIIPGKLRKAESKAEDLYLQILEKINENK